MTARRCPICGKPAREETRPFCSDRCRDRDLNRWLSGAYAIPTDEVPDHAPDEVPRLGRDDD